MKFQNPSLILFLNGRTDGRRHGQAETNMLPLFQSWGHKNPYPNYLTSRRRRGIVVERRTPEREVGGSILTQVAMLCPWARYIYLPKSTGNTQEAVAPSQHDGKIVDWDVKP